jgi:HEPN domain-containing protein
MHSNRQGVETEVQMSCGARMECLPRSRRSWRWCREDRDIAADTTFAWADLLDFTYGVDDLGNGNQGAQTLWRMAAANLADAASALPTASSVDAALQPICMVVELSLKAALVFNGADPNSFRGRRGHDIARFAMRLSEEVPHRDDSLVQAIVAKLPDYVASRYSPAGRTRHQVVRLALAAQFIAGSTTRRFTTRDMAAQLEAAEWPGPRRPFFT